MNIEDLKKLKEQLESEEKFVLIEEFCNKDIERANNGKPLSEYISQENTEEFVDQCETLIENAVRTLAGQGVPFDTVALTSRMGFLCNANFIKSIKPLFKGDNIIDDDDYIRVIDELKTQISSIYVPLSFHLNSYRTGTEDMPMEDYHDEYGISNYSDITNSRVTGIVNFGTFISKMKSLGYNIELAEFGECQNISDYIEAVKENGIDTCIIINADLSKEKEKEESRGLGAR